MNRLFSLSACNMGLGLAHLRLTSQMRCSHFAQSVKFSAKDITLLVSFCFGGGRGTRTPVVLPANGFQDFLTNPTLPQNNRKYQTIENAENPVVSRVFGVLSFPKSKTPSGARISASKTISKTFLEKLLDKSAPNSPVASHILSAKSAATD